MMGSDEAVMGSDEVREENNSSLLQSLEEEVVALRQSESSLIAELQRRCDKMIELEVHLDEERARANRLQRERAEEDEELSGELRDIMAAVALDPTNSPYFAAGAGVPSSDSAETDRAKHSNSSTTDGTTAATTTAAAAELTAGEPAEQRRASGAADEPAAEHPTAEPLSESGGEAAAAAASRGPTGLFAEWLARRSKGGRTGNGVGSNGDGSGGDNSKKAGTKAEPAPSATEEKEEAEGGRGRGDGGELPPPKHRGREHAAGALRARVVELELQRATAEDEMREKMDRSIRLEVQVEQLKNVVQSLSHASAQDGAQASAEKYSETAGMIDLDPLLGGVPGVDPHMLLLLHRSPWADGVIEGIRKEETCFEWQGRDSRGEWSSKLCNLPAELSSLPFHSTGLPPPSPPPPPPPQQQQQQQQRSSKSPSPPSSADKTASDSRHRTPSAGNGDVEPGDHEGGTGGLKEKIGEAVAALGAAGRGLGGGRGGGGTRTVTDQGMTLRFELDNVGLPSEHWEWVGGWMGDSETEASADQDGWVYGRAAAEISEIALGQKMSSSTIFDDRFSGSSGSSGPTATQRASNDEGAADSLEEAGTPPPSQAREAGVEASPPPPRQQPQQQASVSGSLKGSDPASPTPSAEQQANVQSEDPREREHGGGKDGVGAAAVESGDGGGEGEGGAAEAEAEAEDGSGRGGGEGLWLRRRRLVRMRMVRRVDGARESTTSVLEMMRRLCSLDVLVRKLSSQVVAQQRQVTSLESQVAFLAPLHPKLRMACALGRKDRHRGNALQGRLVEAENEIKVLRRCLSAANAPPRSAPRPRPRPRPVPITSTANASNVSPGGRQPPKATGRLSAQELEGAGEMSEPAGPQEGKEGGGEAGGGEPADGGGRVGAEAWGWVEGVAQRAAGTFTRRSRPDAGSEAEQGTSKESAAA